MTVGAANNAKIRGNDNQSLIINLVKSDAELAYLRLQMKHQVKVVQPNIPSAAQRFCDTHTNNVGGPLWVGSELIIIPVADKEHETALWCGMTSGCTTNYSFPINIFSNIRGLPKTYLADMDYILFWRQDIGVYSSLKETLIHLKELPYPYLNKGTGFLSDHHVIAHHSGHDMNMYIRLIIFLEAGVMEDLSNFLDFLFSVDDHPRWKSLITYSLIEDGVLKSPLVQKNLR